MPRNVLRRERKLPIAAHRLDEMILKQCFELPGGADRRSTALRSVS